MSTKTRVEVAIVSGLVLAGCSASVPDEPDSADNGRLWIGEQAHVSAIAITAQGSPDELVFRFGECGSGPILLPVDWIRIYESTHDRRKVCEAFQEGCIPQPVSRWTYGTPSHFKVPSCAPLELSGSYVVCVSAEDAEGCRQFDFRADGTVRMFPSSCGGQSERN